MEMEYCYLRRLIKTLIRSLFQNQRARFKSVQSRKKPRSSYLAQVNLIWWVGENYPVSNLIDDYFLSKYWCYNTA